MPSTIFAVSLLLMLLIALVAAIWIPTALLHRHYDNHIADFTDRLTRFHRISDTKHQIAARIEELRKLDARKLYLKNSSPPLAAAELQGLAARLVESSRGKIVSTQVLPVKDEDGMRRVGLQLVFNGTAVAILQVLHALEGSEQPALFIESITIRAGQGRAYRPVPGVEPEFGVQLNISSYTLISPT